MITLSTYLHIEMTFNKISKSYSDLLETTSVEASEENIKVIRNSIVKFLNENKNIATDFETVETLTFFEIHTKNIASIELKLPEEFRALDWQDLLEKIQNTERPATLVETIAFDKLDLESIFKKTDITDEVETDQNVSSTIKIINKESYNYIPTTTEHTKTIMIYTGSTDETNKTFTVVRTVYDNVRDKEFEDKWISSNPRADLYISQVEVPLPQKVEIDDDHNDSLCKFPSPFSFEKFLIEKEDIAPSDIDSLYSIAMTEISVYRAFIRLAKPNYIECSRKYTIYKYISYIKEIYGIDDDEEAISMFSKFVSLRKRESSVDIQDLDDTRSKRSKTTHIYHFDAIQEIYTESDLELQDQNRDKLNSGSKKGYKLLANSNCDHAPFGYDEDGNPIAPFDFKNDGTVRKKASPYANS